MNQITYEVCLARWKEVIPEFPSLETDHHADDGFKGWRTIRENDWHVCYDEYLGDWAENRLIKATLLKLQRITSSAENQ